MILTERVEQTGSKATGEAGKGAGLARETTTYLQGKKVRTESRGRVYLLDFEKGILTAVKLSEETYTELTLEQMTEAQQKAMQWTRRLRDQLVQNMEKMPPESRSAMQAKLDSLSRGLFEEEADVEFRARATGKEEEINGFPCKAYEVFQEGEKVAVYWLTRSVSTKDFDTYQRELSKWLKGMGPLAGNRLREWDQIRDKGFPIKVIRLKPALGDSALNREILQVEEKSLSESLFQPPDGFRRVESPAFPRIDSPPEQKPVS
jgi:hypothetical protein